MVTSTESLIYAGTMLILALAFMIKRCRDVQFGTCCKFSLSTGVSPQDILPALPPPPTLELPQTTTVADRRNSKEILANAAKIIIPELIDQVMNQDQNAQASTSANLNLAEV